MFQIHIYVFALFYSIILFYLILLFFTFKIVNKRLIINYTRLDYRIRINFIKWRFLNTIIMLIFFQFKLLLLKIATVSFMVINELLILFDNRICKIRTFKKFVFLILCIFTWIR